MSKPVVEVKVRAVVATSGGCAVFLGNEDKVFVMFVDQSVGKAITMFMQGTQKERPLTHDLLGSILRALGAKIERVIVNDLKRGTYFARLVISAENESQQKKIIEIDARPSDCIAMATEQTAPIYVSLDVWDEIEDMTEALRKMQEEARTRKRATRKRIRRKWWSEGNISFFGLLGSPRRKPHPVRPVGGIKEVTSFGNSNNIFIYCCLHIIQYTEHKVRTETRIPAVCHR